MSLATPIPLERLCRLAHVSRAGYYRWQETPPPVDLDLDLRDEIQRIALESPSYGWPRITAELHRRGWEANHKRVYGIMREAGSPLGAALPPPAEIRGDHQLESQSAGVPEPGARDGVDW